MIPFFDARQENAPHREAIEAAIQNVLNSGIYLMGEQTEAFEHEFSRYNDIQHTVSVGSGTAALLLMFQASLHLGLLQPGDEVIVPTNSFTASAMSISQSGLQAVFADVNPITLNLDRNGLEDALTKKTRAVLAVHLYGRSCDMTFLKDFCRQYDLLLFEDAAQALGAKWQGEISGTHGIAAAFSFYPTKNLGSLGNAGAITTSDNLFATTLKKLRNYGMVNKHQHEIIGSNNRIDEFQASILRVKLPFVNMAIKRRQEIAVAYNDNINNVKIDLPDCPSDIRDHTWHLYVSRSRYRNEIIDYLKRHDISCAIHYPVCIHQQEAFRNSELPFLPVAEEAAEQIFSLPNSASLNNHELNTIIDIINQFDLNN